MSQTIDGTTVTDGLALNFHLMHPGGDSAPEIPMRLSIWMVPITCTIFCVTPGRIHTHSPSYMSPVLTYYIGFGKRQSSSRPSPVTGCSVAPDL